MNLCFFINNLEQKKYSKYLNACSLINNLSYHYGIKDKKYNKSILKNELFNIGIYSSKISEYDLKATFYDANILNNFKNFFLKSFLHNYLEFPHIISSNNIVYCFKLPIPKLFFKNKIILELSSIAPYVHEDFFTKKINNYYIFNSIKKADHIIVHTEEMKKALIYKLFSNEDKIKIIPKAINDNFFLNYTNDDLKLINNKYVLNRDYIIFVGKLSKYKNLIRLIDAFLELKLKNIDLLIVGDFNQDYDTYSSNIKFYKNLINYAKENNNIRFLSYIKPSDLAILIKKAKLLVEPSFYNDFPDTILEAYAVNTEVVASNIPVHKNFIKNNNFLFSPYCVNEIKRAINFALNNKNIDKINNINDYNWNNIIIKYKDYLLSLK